MCPVYSVNDVTGLYPWRLAPLRGAFMTTTIPVVSADSDHRLLSWQPFGLRRRGVHTNKRVVHTSERVVHITGRAVHTGLCAVHASIRGLHTTARAVHTSIRAVHTSIREVHVSGCGVQTST